MPEPGEPKFGPEQEPNLEEVKRMIIDFYESRIAKKRQALIDHLKRAGEVQQDLKSLDPDERRNYEEVMADANLIGNIMEMMQIDKAKLEKAQAASALSDFDYFLETLGREVVRLESPEQPEYEVISMVGEYAKELSDETQKFWDSMMEKFKRETEEKMNIIRAIEAIKSKHE